MTPWTAAYQSSLSLTMSLSLLKLMSIELVRLSNHFILGHSCLLLPLIFPSIRVISKALAFRIRWPKHLSFDISPSNEYSGLISFRINWFDLLAVQGTLKSSLAPQWESINSSALSLLHGPTLTSTNDYWKNHSFDCTDRPLSVRLYRPFSVSFFNTLPRFVIALLPRIKHLLISWLQSPSVVILEPKKIFFPLLFAMKLWDRMPWSLCFECWLLSHLFHSPFHLHQESL